MRLTVYSDFSLRVLMYVALNDERRPTIGQIAASYGISRNHVMKVAYDLGAAGYLKSQRGKGGGLALARPPERIGLGELIRRTEPDLALVPCFDPVRQPCVISPACRLRHALHEAQAAFLAVLDGYTLADLLVPAAPLRALLAAGAAHTAT
ncbi:MAG: RrF2 family transcriptional regulator [Caulobacteraceae bacterium]